jgi:PAS domain S-box-containing protein
MYSVLYVDDENSLLELGKLFLENIGDFAIETATSAMRGLEILQSRTFDAIISDYQMPEMDGIVFLKEIRSRHGDLPFILFTGKGREEVVIQAINNGADFYLQKGGDPESQFAELGHKIQQAVQRKRAEDALRINEERLSMAQAIGWIGSWEFDPVTKTLWGSREAFRIFGYPPSGDGTIHLDLVRVCMPDRERVHLAMKNLIEKGEEYNIEYGIYPADGSTKKILHSVGKIHRDASGTVIKVSGVIQDITERKKFEEQIIRERENFHKILSTAPVGLLLINQDRVITQANQYIASIIFREPAEIIGKHAGGGIGCVHSTEEDGGCGFSTSCPECPLRRGIELVLKDGKSLNGAVIDLTLLIHGKPEIHWLSVNAEPVEIEGVRYSIVSVDDITSHMEYEEERIRKSDELNAAYEQIAATEEELRQNFNELAAGQQLLQESRQYLESIVQGSPIPTFVIDKEHRITSWNQALEDYLGISAELVVGKPLAGLAFYKTNRPSLADLIVDQAFDELTKWYEGKFAISPAINGAYEVTDYFPMMKGGTWLFFTASPIYDDAGDLIGAVETLQDITGRKNAEEKLSRTNEELNAAFEELAATEEELRQNLNEFSKNQSDLLESEERFRSAMNHLPGTAWAVDHDLRYTLSQGAGLSLIGLKPDQVVGMRLYEFFNTSDPSHPVISQHMRALSGESIVYDYTHEGVTFRTYLSPLYDTKGTIVGVNGLAFDITEQKLAEAALRKSEERFRFLIDQTDEGVWIIDLDYRTTFVNNRLASMFGYTPGEMLGKMVCEFMPSEDLPVHNQRMKERLAGKSDRFEQKFIRKDGSFFWAIASVTPFVSENNMAGAFAMLSDITDRKRAEEELQESRMRITTVLEGIADTFYSLDDTWRFSAINPAAEKAPFGRPAAGLLGRVIWELYPNIVGTRIHQHYLDAAKNYSLEHYEAQSPLNGRWYEVFMQGRKNGVDVYMRDITARRQTEDALHIANRKLKLLSNITRHDINNQLTVLGGYLNILKKKQHDPALDNYFEKASTVAERISAMIQFTKEYEEIGIHTPAWQDSRTIVELAVKEATLGKVTVKNDFPTGAEVFSDPLIIQVFFNLIDNAVRHGGKITTLRFSVEERNGDHILVCEDDGEGVPPDKKEQIFDRGFGNNTGLGLFLSREILGITGITITENSEPGQGARFEMTVPEGMYR